jgi:hypothetical protein
MFITSCSPNVQILVSIQGGYSGRDHGVVFRIYNVYVIGLLLFVLYPTKRG